MFFPANSFLLSFFCFVFQVNETTSQIHDSIQQATVHVQGSIHESLEKVKSNVEKAIVRHNAPVPKREISPPREVDNTQAPVNVFINHITKSVEDFQESDLVKERFRANTCHSEPRIVTV